MSVGLLVVRLLYGLYVFGHLSKWFAFSVFLPVTFCRVVVFLHLHPTVCVALVADCGRISFQDVRWLMRETNHAKRASPAINATQCVCPA